MLWRTSRNWSKCFQARNPSSVISLNRSLSSIIIFDSVWPDTLDAILPAVDAGYIRKHRTSQTSWHYLFLLLSRSESTYSGLWCYQHRRKRPDRLDNQVKDCLFVSAIVAGRIIYCNADCTISIMSICRIKYDHSLCVIETKQTEERFMDNWDWTARMSHRFYLWKRHKCYRH